MKKFNLFFSILFCGCLLCAATFTARAQSGTTGNLSWSISDGTLTISGTGAMPDYFWTFSDDTYITTAPWGFYRNSFIAVAIGNSVTSIGDSAFEGCSGLSEVTIPNSVTSIGYDAFYGCTSLTSIYNLATTPQTIHTEAFGKVDKTNCKLCVPAASVSAYKDAAVWKEFNITTSIAPIIVSGVSLNKSIITLCIGNTERIIATVAPASAVNKTVTWTSSDNAVATVSTNGTITAVAAGNTTITATTNDGGKTATCNVTVTSPDQIITISTAQNGIIKAGRAGTVFFAVATENIANGQAGIITWYTSPFTSSATETTAPAGITSSVSNVSSNAATITINATTLVTQGNYYFSVTIGGVQSNIVTLGVDWYVAVTGIISHAPWSGVNVYYGNDLFFAVSLNVGDVVFNYCGFTPDGVTDRTVIWSSSNAAVASIDQNGMITAKSIGETYIVATSNDGGYTSTMKLYVGDTTGTEDIETSLFRIYPNPTEGMITLEFETAAARYITISDTGGKTLLRQTASDQTVRIDMSNYPDGVYLITIDDGKQQSTKKIVKN